MKLRDIFALLLSLTLGAFLGATVTASTVMFIIPAVLLAGWSGLVNRDIQNLEERTRNAVTK